MYNYRSPEFSLYTQTCCQRSSFLATLWLH